MEFQKVLETRRTVRKYSAGVTREQMEELLRAAQEAPSWKNLPDRPLLLCPVRRDGR